MTGMEEHYIILPLTINLRHRLLYRPQLAVDGNMKLVHQIQKQPDDDVSLSDTGALCGTFSPCTSKTAGEFLPNQSYVIS